jgi:predicted flap endonuclease-1-like 5' DNA nuclease
MSIWIAFAGGIILGWIIEWIIDWLYWRRGIAGFYATENELRGQLQNVQQEHVETSEKLTALNTRFDEITVAKSAADQQLQDVTVAKSSIDQQLQEVTAAKETVDRQLQEVSAAKMTVEQQLLETTTAKAATEQTLQETLAAKATLEQQLREALDTLAEARQPRRDDLEQIDGIGRVYEQKLFDAGINTFAQLAVTPVVRLKEIINPASWQQLDFESWLEQARKMAEIVTFDLLPYRLEEINGIGPAYAKRLNAEGIMTFTDLAHCTEERLRAIIPQRGGLPHDFAGWIREARAFVSVTAGDRPPLPLERIKGIGPVFATKLDLAGIHTYADLAAANEDQVREIIGTRGVQIANFGRWIEEAKAEVGGGVHMPAPSEVEIQSGNEQIDGSQANGGASSSRKSSGSTK